MIMGKVSIIKKSRKECTCGKCRKVIPVGSTYYRGTLNFRPDIVRCSDCKLESWEVTTSEYQLAVGEIVYRWQSNYSMDESGIQELSNDLEVIKDECEEKLDNMPESLQESDTGLILQERIDQLDGAIMELDSIDIDSLKSEIEDELIDSVEEATPLYEEIVKDGVDWNNPDKYNDYMGIEEALLERIVEEIDSAISELA